VRPRAFRWWDALVVAGLVLANLAALGAVAGRGPAAGVEIVSPAGTRVVPFGAGRVEVEGPLGVTVVDVGPDGARVVSSPCPLQICVRTGTVRRPGRVAACVPNRVAVRVVGRKAGGSGVDAVDAVGR